MKIDRSKLRKAQSELPSNCQQLIHKLKEANDEEIAEILKGIQTWHFGKCELFHWIDVLDKFDAILANVSKHAEGSDWILVYDQLHQKDKEQAKKYKELISNILKFTGLLVEHSYARHIYSSMEHLIALLSASDMEVVLCVLNVLYIFSKRSNFISRLPVEQRKTLHQRLYCLAESWGGDANGFGLAHCSKDLPADQFPESASNVHFEFYGDAKKEDEKNKTPDLMERESSSSSLTIVHLEGVHKLSESPGEIMEKVLKKHKIPEDKKIKLFSRIRLARHFHFYAKRIKCLQARLQAISILVYSTSNQENTVNQLLYPGFVEEIVDAIRLNDTNSRYADISSASLRTLTAIIHLERNSRLNSIIEATGANSYHGFLPTLVRNCIQAMTESKMSLYSHGFATALFSFLYHLASYEAGGEALVSCGLMESLLKVIDWPGEEDCITFVTRAVRVVDLITNLDMAGFQNHGGLAIVLNRLEREVKLCQPHHGGILSNEPAVCSPAESSGSTESMEVSPPPVTAANVPRDSSQGSSEALMDTDGTTGGGSSSTSEPQPGTAMDVDDTKAGADDDASKSLNTPDFTKHSKSQIIPQRAALLKSILNFFKKAILDPSFSDSVRTVMDGSLPTSLKYIISNVEYYGPALYLLATDVVTVYVFHEPSLLSSLQDKDLTGVVLKSLVAKDIPATREVLAFLPNILSALCLNNRGLQAFMACKPFDKLFKVLLSPDYLPAMRRRRSSDALGDTAYSLGTAMDELMRHQPMLKPDAMKAIVKLLEEVCRIGSDPKVTCFKSAKTDSSLTGQGAANEDDPVSDEEEYDEDRLPVPKTDSHRKVTEEQDVVSGSSTDKKKYVPLTDYILNVVKFVDAILSNNSTDDHIREFVRHQGLEPLIKILSLPNLPLDFPSSPACQSIGIVSRSILFLCQEHQLLHQGLQQLTNTLKTLEPLRNCLTTTGQSVLLQEVLKSPKPFQAINSHHQTPLLHAMAATQSYVNMFTYICKSIQNDVRTICINHWGERIETLQDLCELYSSLVWESSVLLVLCTQEKIPDECKALKEDVKRLTELVENDAESSGSESDRQSSENTGRLSDGSRTLSDDIGPLPEAIQTPPDQPGTSSEEATATSESQKPKPKMSPKLRLLKHLLAASSRLGRSLAEFFSLLVRLAVGSGQRQRRPQHMVTPAMPTIPGKLIASQLAKLLTRGLSWKDPEKCPLPRLNLTFYICSLGFVHPMLFDDRKNPYHLMLQHLVTSGGLRALYDRFQWVVSRETAKPSSSNPDEHSTLPQGSEEFVNAWLSLMERLVNPKLIMDSQHTLPAPAEGGVNRNGFEPRKFLMNTQKHGFSAVNILWEHKPLKSYGILMKQSMLSILCHIIHGEKLLKIHKKPDTQSTENSAATAETQDVNEEHLRQLMDMGFTREHARTALLNTATIEQATEYALTRAPAPTQATQQLGISLEMSEEDQMMQAIALSLGENFPMVVDQPPSVATEVRKPEETKESEQKSSRKDEDQDETLDSSVIDNFAANMLPGCVSLVSDVPETVYKACDLIVAISARNGHEWRDRVLGDILNTVRETAIYLCDLYATLDVKNEGSAEKAAEYCIKPQASLLKSMLHLLSLILEEMKSPCALLFIESGAQEILGKLLSVVQKCLVDLKSRGDHPTTPSWLTPLLILTDLYEKSVDAHHRKIAHDKCTGSVWKWFDDRSGRWHNYSTSNNNTIDTAYRKGETSIRFTAGRRRYVVHFDTMIQVNEDSGNRRPIMLEVTPSTSAASADQGKTPQETKKTSTAPEQPKTTEQQNAEAKTAVSPEESIKLVSLPNEQKEYLVRSCVSLISLPVENNALNAAVRLCVRLTRDSHLAQIFVEAGGPHHILELKRSSKFDGFVMLLTLLLRHVLEDRDTLRHTMEKVIRSAVVSGIGSSNSGVGSNSLGTKEFNYLLRVLSPVAARQPEIFKELLLKSMRFTLPVQLKRGGQLGNEVTIPPNQAFLVNTVPVGKPPKIPKVSENVKGVVYELLNALCKGPEDSKADDSIATEEIPCDSQGSGPSQSQVGRTLGELGDLLDGRPTPSLVRHLTGESLPTEDIEDMIIDIESSCSQSSSTNSKDKNKESEATKIENDTKPLLNKKTVLGILSELVKSYSGVAQLIAEYEVQRPGKQSNSQIPVLAFIMDHLLPSDSVKNQSDHSHRARLLLTVIAACNHSPDAQAIFVSELKDSLARALAMPESQQKHLRLQALFQLILGIFDSGCSTQQQNSNSNATQQNGTVKLFVKKGVVSDLARVSQSLDLSSPSVVATINGLLKPLEKLSNFVNLPTPANPTTGANEKKDGSLGTTSRTSDVAEHILRVSGNRVANQDTRASPEQRREFSDLDSSGLHIEGRAVLTDTDQSYVFVSEGETDTVNDTAVSAIDSEQPEGNERVPESDDDFSSPSLDALVIEIHHEASHDSSVGQGGGEEGNYNHGRIDVDNEDEDDDDEEDEEDPDEDEDDEDDHRSDGEDEEIEAEEVATNEEGRDDGVVVESYNGVIMLEDEGEESEDHDDDDDDDDDEDDDEEEGSEIEGHERHEFGDAGHGNAGGSAINDDYLFLHLDEPRQGSISRLIREHGPPPGAILASSAFRGGLFAGLRPNPTSAISPSVDLNVEHPLLRRQQSTERRNQIGNSRVSRVHLLRSDRGRAGHMTHVHVHYSHPHDLPRFGRHLVDDDIRLITRAGHRRLGDEDFADIFDFGEGPSNSNILSDISSPLSLWTQESLILDGGSVHQCAAAVKKEVLPVLEKDLEQQVEVVRETERKKKKEEEGKKLEEAAKKGKEKEESKGNETGNELTTTPSSEPMQVESAVSQPSLTETVSGREEEGHVYTEAGETAQASGETSNAPETPTNPAADKTTASEMSVEPSNLTSPIDRPLEMHVEASNITPRSQTGDVPQSDTPQEPTPNVQSGNSEMQVEASGMAASDTPNLAPRPPQVADVISVPEAGLFVTPNPDTPIEVCPGAPTRVLLETPDVSDPNLAPTPSSPDDDDLMDTTGNGSSPSVFPNTRTPIQPAQEAEPTDPTHAFVESLSLFATERVEASNPQNPPAVIDGVQIPEGVDPSFLEALPEAIRREVIAEQLALRRTPAPSSGPSTSSGGENSGTLNVSPEFLAALPPEVQDEVLQQQRLEQERQRVRTMTPEEPVDPGTFLRNLPPALRQQILTDMDDSQLSVLPEDLSTQAQSLRREFEARQTRLMHERYAFGGDSDAASAISALLRRSGYPRRVGRIGRGGSLQFSRLIPPGSGWGRGPGFSAAAGPGKDKKSAITGRQILDNEALVCLLILLFVDEPRINITRLHKVIRNFCYHEETRQWVIQSLISILRRTSGQNPDGSCAPVVASNTRGKGPGKKSDNRTRALEDQLGETSRTSPEVTSSGSSWLNMSVDAALGCRARIFNVQKTGKSSLDKSASNVSVNAQASSFVCKHVLDALAALAKNFPASFTPQHVPSCPMYGGKDEPVVSSLNEAEFWSILVKLDGTYGGKKGKVSAKNTSSTTPVKNTDFNASPIGYLMSLLSHPVIRKNANLMDSLLRLLSVISASLPDNANKPKALSSNEQTTAADAIRPTTPSNQSTASTGRAQTPESVTSSLIVETSPRGLEPETDSVDSGPTAGTLPQEPMDVEVHSVTVSVPNTKNQSLDVVPSDNVISGAVVMAPQLKLAAEVLTSGACSEDGLEDATTLLLQVSKLNSDTRDAVLSLLLMGVRDLGNVLQGNISRLLEELRTYNATHGTVAPSEKTQKEPLEQVLAFQRLNRPVNTGNAAARLYNEQRFGGGTGTRGRRRNQGQGQQRHIRSLTYDLHLPAMASFTEKTSSQNLFLRGLRVILQLRVAARKAAAAAKKEVEKKKEQEARETAKAKATSNEGNSEKVTEAQSDEAGPSQVKDNQESNDELPRISSQLALEELWDTLSECLSELARTSDRNAVLVLQPAVEAFFLVHGTEKEDSQSNAPVARGRSVEIARLASIRSIDEMPPSPGPTSPGGSLSPTLQTSFLADLPIDQQVFLKFAEMHQTVLNHILRQSTTHLADGPFAVLVDHTRFLDFDVKRRYFRHELERLNEGAMRRDDLSIHVRRDHVFEDSYRELHRRSHDDMKSRLYVVFEGEEGQDAGGLLREWFMIMSREMFNPNYALFRVSPGDRVTYLPNPSSHCNSNHLSYFKFVGRVVAKAIYDNKLLDAYFTRSFYKHILGIPVKVSDMEAEDYSFYQGLVYLLEHDIDEFGVELTFSTDIEEFGVSEVRDLKANGRNIPVTEDNKKEYVKLICQEKMTGSIRKQIESFLEGFYEIIPKRLISIFDEQELELLISGLPTIDLDDLKANTEYHKYNESSLQIQWLWRALRSFDQADRAKFLQFVTGTSKVPLQGFAALEGMNGLQKFQIHRDDRSTDRLPAAHTCFNQLDLPAYETYDKLRSVLLKTIHECPEGFGLA